MSWWHFGQIYFSLLLLISFASDAVSETLDYPECYSETPTNVYPSILTGATMVSWDDSASTIHTVTLNAGARETKTFPCTGQVSWMYDNSMTETVTVDAQCRYCSADISYKQAAPGQPQAQVTISLQCFAEDRSRPGCTTGSATVLMAPFYIYLASFISTMYTMAKVK